MNIQKSLLLAVTSLLLTFTYNEANAFQNAEKHPIPYLEDAKIFAQFTDELPAVINYFTAHNEQEIINFYQGKFGDATNSEMKRNRLTLYFNHSDKQLRVVISKQGTKSQVDILLK
ncbi:MAG: hypothetical protein P8I03_00710 [Thalassotalea sp.]|nr:hypothetical protein [Thalassotalea sp.]